MEEAEEGTGEGGEVEAAARELSLPVSKYEEGTAGPTIFDSSVAFGVNQHIALRTENCNLKTEPNRSPAVSHKQNWP